MVHTTLGGLTSETDEEHIVNIGPLGYFGTEKYLFTYLRKENEEKIKILLISAKPRTVNQATQPKNDQIGTYLDPFKV